MTTQTLSPAAAPRTTALQRLAAFDWEQTGQYVIRYGLVLALGWIGLMKFTAYEAGAIEGLVANSPFLAWIYAVLGVQQAAVLMGSVEFGVAVLIALRPLSAKAAAVGSFLAIGVFLTTLSFLFTTPGVGEPSLGGFPALSVVPGQFLIKDFVLLGAAIWSFGEAMKARR